MSIHREKVSKDEQGSGLQSDSKKLLWTHVLYNATTAVQFQQRQQKCNLL